MPKDKKRKDDAARQYTDAQLRTIEKRIKKFYSDARNELTAEWEEYMRHVEEHTMALYTAYQNDPNNEKLKQDYINALNAMLIYNQRYREMINDTTYRIAQANQIARNYVNRDLTNIYVRNYLQLNEDLTNMNVSMGTMFSIRDEATLRRLISDGEIPIPQGIVNTLKDTRYNRQRLNSAVLQGVLRGESIPEIAKRINPILDGNQKGAIRTARTLVTGAENRGRQDSYVEMENKGVVMRKVWLATPDGRTRDWHISMDEQEVDVKDYFLDGLGNELEYPGDPGAPGETIYNCRCSMRTHILGFKDRSGNIHYTKNYEHNGLHQQQMAEEKRRREEEKDG